MSDISSFLTTASISRRDALMGLARGASLAALGSSVVLSTATEAAAPASDLSGDAIIPFRVAVPQARIDDLKRRLRATRWPDRETVSDWSQGVPLDSAKRLVAYWHDRYDWRKFERKLTRIRNSVRRSTDSASTSST